MPMDDYDSGHNNAFHDSLNVYCDDDVDTKLSEFFTQRNITLEYAGKVVNQMREQIKTVRESLKIMDSRCITCISSRICHYYIVPDLRNPEYIHQFYSNIKPTWYLINVLRGKRVVAI